MADLYWHKIVEHCPSCSKPLTIISVSFSADGRFLLDWYCMSEQKKAHTQYLMAQCICKAFESDLEQSFMAADLRVEAPDDDGAGTGD